MATTTFRDSKNNMVWVRPDGPYSILAPRVSEPISPDNPGFKMMKSMGWVEGTPLGCRGEGILQPVETHINEIKGTSGLGYTGQKGLGYTGWEENFWVKDPNGPSHTVSKPLSVLREEDYNQREIEDYLLSNGPGITDEEKEILKELNDSASMDTLSGEGRLTSLLSIDPKDMEIFEDNCNMREARHALIARSPMGGIYYNVSPAMQFGDALDASQRKLAPRKSRATDSSELDVNNRIIVEATILNKGPKHDNAVTEFGKVYIDKKFTRYVPPIGEKVKMVIGMKGCNVSHPWNCYRILG